jgi:hypothetical protein
MSMDERQKMQVENLREYLKLYHQLLLLMLTVSMAFFLFSWRFEEGRRIDFYQIGVPINLAWIGILVLFPCFAGFAFATLNRAAEILERLKSSNLLDAILQYPSVATDRSRLVRLGPVLLPVLLIAGGMSMEFIREAAAGADKDWGFASIVAFFVLYPTYKILGRVTHPLGSPSLESRTAAASG